MELTKTQNQYNQQDDAQEQGKEKLVSAQHHGQEVASLHFFFHCCPEILLVDRMILIFNGIKCLINFFLEHASPLNRLLNFVRESDVNGLGPIFLLQQREVAGNHVIGANFTEFRHFCLAAFLSELASGVELAACRWVDR